MFSKGQTLFALAFAITFIIALFFMYRKDANVHKKTYKGVKWVLLGFILFILFLFLIKTVIKE
ncbi:hypothetical protein [Flavobacterium sp.]|jgi:hypothetical protein|uniref:hypothetical protein n=1 Tax=Flavobacterium sp. TaxID=239 RepID=UPI0025C46C24|nr:hypothetical protein [Flavobacterium sp.]